MASDHTGEVAVGFSGSDHARDAVWWAAYEASARKRSLLIVHAKPAPLEELTRIHLPVENVEAEQPDSPAFDMAAECGRRLPDLDVRADVRLGHPAKVLGEVAERAEMLVLGPSEPTRSWRVLLGSTAAELVRTAHVPVVIVRGEREAERIAKTPTEFRRVVVGVDGSRRSIRAVEFAYEFAALHDAELVALLAWHELGEVALRGAEQAAGTTTRPGKTGSDPSEIRATCERLLAESVAGTRQRYPEVTLRSEVTTTQRPADALFSASAEADLLVVGSQGRGPIRSSLLGSVGHAVAHYARCPVAVVH